jgi:biotin operon repressor
MNKGKRWQEEENISIISNILNNISINQISNLLGRSEYAISKQIEKLLSNYGVNITELYQNLLIQKIKEYSNKFKIDFKINLNNNLNNNFNNEIFSN